MLQTGQVRAIIMQLENTIGKRLDSIEEKLSNQSPAPSAYTLTVAQAAKMGDMAVKTLQNIVSKHKRTYGKDLSFIARKGQRKGFVVIKKEYEKWLSSTRRGRPRKS